MGFFANSIRRTLFDKQSYNAAVNATDGTNGYAVIKIVPQARTLTNEKDLEVIGIIQNGLSFNIDATWSEFGGLSELAPDIPILGSILGAADNTINFLNTGAARSGIAEIGSVYKSKKFYRKSGDIRISPILKIVDWEGTGQPLLCSQIIAALLLPGQLNMSKLSKEARKVYDNTTGFAGRVLQGANNLIDKVSQSDVAQFTRAMTGEVVEGAQIPAGVAKSAVTNIDNGTDNIASSTLTLIEDTAITGLKILAVQGKTLLEGADDLVTLRSSPMPVKVQIGNYFEHKDMVITNASFNFSKECTQNGPLYVDISLELSSRTILSTIDDVGFQFSGEINQSNISFTGER